MKLTCKEVVRLVSGGQDRDLPPEQQALLREHYELCNGCRSMRERMAFLRRAMKQITERGT